MSGFDRNTPFLCKLLTRYPLNTASSSRQTWHVVLDLQDSQILYEPGDSIAVLPQNDPQRVQGIIRALHATGNEPVTTSTGQIFSLEHFLLYKANIATATKKLLSACNVSFDSESDTTALQQYISAHDVYEVITENNARLPLDVFTATLQPLLPRFYSIASSQRSNPETVDLTVAYVSYSVHGKERRGVCSHFLCDLVPLGSPTVPIYLQKSRDFHLPQNNMVPIIMIGPGTGVAPFRAFMQERERQERALQERALQEHSGKNWLFFGERNRQSDFFYEQYWQELVLKNLLTIDTAFSRDQEEKIYVQHRLWEKRVELFTWIAAGAVLYVCGDASRMAKDVDHTLHRIVQEEGRLSEDEAKAFIKRLRQEKRYLRDVY